LLDLHNAWADERSARQGSWKYKLLGYSALKGHLSIAASGGSRSGVWGGESFKWAPKVSASLNSHDSLWRFLGITQKWLPSEAKKWLFLLIHYLCVNHHSLKALYTIFLQIITA